MIYETEVSEAVEAIGMKNKPWAEISSLSILYLSYF